MFRLNLILKNTPFLILIALVNIILFRLIYWQCPMKRINKKPERNKKKKEKRKPQKKNSPRKTAQGPLGRTALDWATAAADLSPRVRSLSLSLCPRRLGYAAAAVAALRQVPRSSLDPSPATSVRQVFPLAPFPFSS
jgi:hypothetical protein